MFLRSILVILFLGFLSFNPHPVNSSRTSGLSPTSLGKTPVQSAVTKKPMAKSDRKVMNETPFNPQIEKLIQSTQNDPFDKRLEVISRFFLGKRYSRYTLGEGRKGRYDQKPLYRFDRFDCTTYIETVMALSYAANPKDFIRYIKEIRYKNAKISFLTRNHFPSVDWIPNNIKAHFIKDITEELAGSIPVEKREIVIDKKKWLKTMPKRRLSVPGRFNPSKILRELRKTQTSEKNEILTYINLETIISDEGSLNHILKNIPSGSIINIIQSNSPSTYRTGSTFNVIHQGLCIYKNGIPYFRHASSTRLKRVVEIPPKKYLHRVYYMYILGINVLKIQRPTEIKRTSIIKRDDLESQLRHHIKAVSTLLKDLRPFITSIGIVDLE